MATPELREFLEGIDSTAEKPAAMSSGGFLKTMSRLYLFTLPSLRTT